VPVYLLAVTSTSAPPTTLDSGGVVTVKGGPYTTANVPGPAQDPADFYGIILVVALMLVAILASRWLFGRKGSRRGAGR
jgi:hypothetical protein